MIYCVHIHVTDLCSLLHMVTPHPSDHSQQAFLRMAFGSLYCHISVQILHCDLFQYADDSTLISGTVQR